MINFKSSITFALLLLLIGSTVSAQHPLKIRKLEDFISQGIRVSTPFSVFVIAWDTVKNEKPVGVFESDGFSGVIVSEQGHILTAAHAINVNQVYQVRFVDGRRYTALPLGRIGRDENKAVYDMGVIKIIEREKFACAPMANGSEMVLNQPVLSISYPSSFLLSTPNVRYGRISNTRTAEGFIQSSAKMEPGDSGGGLFDLKGQLIGIHSRIKEHESQNFDIPVDSFRRYWTALNKPIDYQQLPVPDTLRLLEPNPKMQPFPSIHSVLKIRSKLDKSVATILSNDGDQVRKIMGTWVRFRNKNYLISKSSMVAVSPRILLNGKIYECKVISRERTTDLILLKPNLKIGSGIRLKVQQASHANDESYIGKIIISVLPNKFKKTGIISNFAGKLPPQNSIGYLDVSARYQDGKIVITDVPLNKAISSKLMRDDHILNVEGRRITKPEDFINAFLTNYAGDLVKLDIIRKGMPFTVETYLEGQPMLNHASYAFSGGRSERSDGFDNVLVGDATIESSECGSPVFDRTGRFCGVNIARHSRTSVLILPAACIWKFLAHSFQKT